MSEPNVFDSRSPQFKSHYGAAPCGTSITYTCRPLASDHFTHCAIVMKHEFSRMLWTVEMPWVRQEDGRDCFSAAIPTPRDQELVWYHFRFWRDDGTGCFLDKTGYHCRPEMEPWQLTVYRPSYTPKWFGDGVVYQIFPDRFCRLSVPDPAGMVGDRQVHEDWSDIPEWRPDEDGIVQNRDFFGGSLPGITSKLDYLSSLGVSVIYLCPIFESASNHRYNTADFTRIDPMLGTEADFRELCHEARRRGIRMVLDGVFNHIGSQSLYFNQDGWYPTLGAAQSQDSPYYDWFSFHPWPDSYDSWWGIQTLPNVREESPTYVEYMVTGPDSIVRRWLRAGASGWRLDVADELPDWFIEKVRLAVEETDPDALLLGEVWEDASNKISYSSRRRYFLGTELHGVMDYPFRASLMDYLRGRQAESFYEAMETLRENYPPEAFLSVMNFLSTHDTSRILTVLGAETTPECKDDRAVYRLSPAQRKTGLALVRLAALILFTFPGAPTIYYGDEMAMEGFEDPFNRGAVPWDHGDQKLIDWFSLLGRLRRDHKTLRRGALHWLLAQGPLLAYAREFAGVTLITLTNASPEPQPVTLPWPGNGLQDLLSGKRVVPQEGRLTLELGPYEGMLLSDEEE